MKSFDLQNADPENIAAIDDALKEFFKKLKENPEAVALAGGANPNLGDAASVYVFRYVRTADGTEQPTVYHVNMMKPDAYLLSQRFLMHDRDVLYVANARANQLTKFVQLLSQLFVPVTTVRSVASPGL